jgi:hypothetical protein
MPPLFQDDSAVSFQSTSGFYFSGTSINKLGASEYTLVGIAADVSSSVTDFAQEIEGCLMVSIEGCQRSPRADNLLVRFLTFSSHLQEEHGFRPLTDCHPQSYKGCIKPSGTTSLYDAATNMIDSMATYGKDLTANDYTANGIVVILTDGMDVGSTLKVKDVKESVIRAKKSEALESLTTILVGINVKDAQVSAFLKAFKDDAGFDQYIEASDATPKTFARIAGFISKSVSSASQSIGTGAASQPITF